MAESIGIVGCGSIGQAIIREADAGRLDVPVVGVASRTASRVRPSFQPLSPLPHYFNWMTWSTPVPWLSRRPVGTWSQRWRMPPSVRARVSWSLASARCWSIRRSSPGARETGCRLLAPSGAIAGLDGIKSACAGHVDSVTMVSRKPPQALEGAPYLVEREISLVGLEQETELFSGTAREACRGFPANLNVSAAVSLAGVGPDKTTVRIMAVPGLERNCHDIEVVGEFGRLAVHIENIPSENPKTGRLTAMSIIRSIRDAVDPVRIGT